MSRRWMGLAAIAGLVPGLLPAQGWIERPEHPAIVRPVPSPVVRTASTVRVRLEGRVARFEVEEWFRNTGGTVAEGNYLYPMPGEAVFTDFSLFAGDQELKGEMMNAEQARGIYEEIVRKLRDPALLTLAGHGLIRAQVFPIQPGETRRVVLRYNQLLARDGDAFRLRYALGARGNVPITLTVRSDDAERFGVPYSPTHRLEWNADGGRLTVRSECAPGGDFELLLPVRRGMLGTTVVTHAPSAGERFAMVVVSPPAVAADAGLARDLTLVVDVSGSMSGTKLEQAKAALHQALGSLRRTDRFRLIAFSNGVSEFRPEYRAASAEAVRQARQFVDDLEARGGTNIAGALDAALRGAGREPERLGIVLFVTDGLPSVGEQAPEKIAAAAAASRRDLRIFPIGLGHDVNTYLLDRLAVEGRGRVEFVAPNASVEHALGAVMTRIDAPVLTDLRIVRSPVRLEQRTPADLPDLFSGEELVVFARYQGSGTGDVVIEGTRNGRRHTFANRVTFAAHETGNTFIAPLWAAGRIGELTRQVRLEGHSPALVQEIRELGLRYGIITEYTSYLVQEPPAGPVPLPRSLEGRLRLDETVGTATPRPAAQTGAEEFRKAERSADLAKAKSLAAADAAVERDLNASAVRGERKRVGGRLFAKVGSVWTDVAHTDSLEIVDVAPFSPAWFALTRALPEVVPLLAAGEEVLVSGRRISVRTTASGLREWPAGRLDRLVREFRGS